MEEVQDYYKIVGTNREAISYYNRDSEAEKDKFIKEKYEHTKKLLEIKKTNKSPEELAKIEYELKSLEKAYLRIKDASGRYLYNKKLDEIKEEEKQKKEIITIPREKTAYDILRISKNSLGYRTEKSNDAKIKENRDSLLDLCNKALKSSDFTGQQKMKLEIQRIQEAYEKIKTVEKREVYNIQLEQKEQQRAQLIKSEQIRRKYSHEKEYEPDLIKSVKDEGGRTIGKLIAKENKRRETSYYPDAENRELQITETGVIAYKNVFDVQAQITEYEVKRKINGEEKKDTIYTELVKPELSIRSKTGEPYNPEYYDYVMNHLLSEEVIEGAKYNEGYIGLVEKREDGNYHLTIEDEKLAAGEKEALSAIKIIKEHERRKERAQSKGESR